MATFDYTVGDTGFPYTPSAVAYVEKTVELAVTPSGASDVFKLIDVPAKSVVLAVSLDVVTAQGGVLTAGVGDSGSATRFLTAADLNVVAASASVAPRFYAAADDLRLTFSANPGTKAKFVLRVLLGKLG